MDKRKTNIIIITASVLLVVLLSSTIILFTQTQQNKQTINELVNVYSELKINYNSLEQEKQGLEIKIVQLNDTKTKLETEKKSLTERNRILEKDLDETLSLIDTFKELINTSMGWFSLNHDFNNRIEEVEDTDNMYILAQLYKCKKEEADYCKIKSGCLPFINTQNGVTYIADWRITGKIDYLKDIITTLDDKGGDCEDQSLLFVAEYNYLIDECMDMGYLRDEIKINTYVYEPGTMYFMTYDEQSRIQHYYPNSKPVDIANGDNYFYVVCGGRHDSKTGHCVVALTAEKIERSTELYGKLDGAPLIEPQTGQLVGYINRGDAWHILPNGQMPTPAEEIIYLVILEDDIIIFNYKYLKDELYQWVGYEDFYNRLQRFEEVLGR